MIIHVHIWGVRWPHVLIPELFCQTVSPLLIDLYKPVHQFIERRMVFFQTLQLFMLAQQFIKRADKFI